MRGGRWVGVEFPALCGLMEHPTRGIVLFDTGYSNHFFAATRPFPERFYRWVTPVTLSPEETLLSQLAVRGIRASDVRQIVVSHFHADHVAGLRDFPAARVTMMRAEYDAIRRMSRIGGLFSAVLPALMPPDFEARIDFADDAPAYSLPSALWPFERGFDLFSDGSLIAVPLPGHTEGQMGVVFRRSDDSLVFMVADACWSLKALAQGGLPAWLAERMFANPRIYRRTFAGLREIARLGDASTLIPSHCDETWKAQRR